jgi:hypothetical protein
MTNWYLIWMASKLREQETGRDLRRRQLAQAVTASRQRTAGMPSHALLSLGFWLVERGWQLNRSGEETCTDVFQWGRFEIRARHPTTQP